MTLKLEVEYKPAPQFKFDQIYAIIQLKSPATKDKIMIRAYFRIFRFSNFRIDPRAFKPNSLSVFFSHQRKTVLGSGVMSLILCGSGSAVLCAAEQLKKDEIAKEVETGKRILLPTGSCFDVMTILCGPGVF